MTQTQTGRISGAGASARPLGAVVDQVVARATPAAWGPWAPGLDRIERAARLRSLGALVRVLGGPDQKDLVALLRRAEADDNALAEARRAVDKLPSLVFRRIVSTWGVVNLEGGR